MTAPVLPDGYEPWSCDTCTAACTFEAMSWCAIARSNHPEAPCGFDQDEPEAINGFFEFIIRSDVMSEKLDRFKKEIETELAGRTAAEYVAMHPGKHLFGTYGNFRSCAFCGNLERRDGTVGTCVGIVKVLPR